MAKFNIGDRVAWSHAYATQFPAGIIVRATAVPQGPADEPGNGRYGTVEAIDDTETLFSVALDDGSDWTLCGDELVKIDETS